MTFQLNSWAKYFITKVCPRGRWNL